MKSCVKILLKKIFPTQTRLKFKKYKRYIASFLKDRNQTTLEELEKILRNKLRIKKGDKIIVVSSFGYLNANYSPAEVVQLLMDIVTEEGGIMMPFYPPVNSVDWAKEGQIFDMENTKSGMGVLTNIFSKMPNVFKSIHPTKAICVWGKDAEEIVKGHEIAKTPFYWDSPYGKYLKMGCKSLGLGLKNIPIVHTIEDVLSENINAHYYPDMYSLKVITADRKEIIVDTYIHDDELSAKCISPGDFTKSLNCTSYKRVDFGLSFLYIIDNTDLYNKVKSDYENGNKNLRLR